MVGMPGQYALGPVKLLGQHRAHQHVRPGRRAERKHEVRFFSHGLGQAVRAADHEADRARAVVAPAPKALGKNLAGFVTPALVQCDDLRARRDRGQQGLAFTGLAHIGRKILLDFDFLQLDAPGQPREVALIKLALRSGFRLADGGDQDMKRSRGQARFVDFFVGAGEDQMRSI